MSAQSGQWTDSGHLSHVMEPLKGVSGACPKSAPWETLGWMQGVVESGLRKPLLPLVYLHVSLHPQYSRTDSFASFCNCTKKSFIFCQQTYSRPVDQRARAVWVYMHHEQQSLFQTFPPPRKKCQCLQLMQSKCTLICLPLSSSLSTGFRRTSLATLSKAGRRTAAKAWTGDSVRGLLVFRQVFLSACHPGSVSLLGCAGSSKSRWQDSPLVYRGETGHAILNGS